MKALILAAGFGTRMQPYTKHTPKALFPVAGRPLLEKIISHLAAAGCTAVMINTHHLHHKIEVFVAAKKFPLPVYTRYEPQILGTGGAIRNVADFWDARPFMVINADIVFDIDLKAVYTAHCRNHPAATLVLCDDPAFNTVAVDPAGKVLAFYKPIAGHPRPPNRRLTFTGIQVLEPELLNYIPPGRPYSSIEAFTQLMVDGKQIQSFIIPRGRWNDLGTPERYRRAVLDKALPEAFSRCCAKPLDRPLHWKELKGDGSERQWFRVQTAGYSLIMVDHGIRQSSGTQEVDAFVQIGHHLARQGVAVPKIYYQEPFCGMVFLEDLGDVNLQQTVQATDQPDEVLSLYRQVIDQLLVLSQKGAAGFNHRWAYQGSQYDQPLILEKECRYFVEAFLTAYLGFDTRFENLEKEFVHLAQGALKHAVIGFMHRDMQSRNIMVKNRRTYFIDFQAGRLGPLQYDLASLLIDPYVDLPAPVQEQLLDYCLGKLSAETAVQHDKFLSSYHYCTLTRNLQILGAFAHLSKIKGKHYFEAYIPAAVSSLKRNLCAGQPDEFPALTAVVQKAYAHLQKGSLRHAKTK